MPSLSHVFTYIHVYFHFRFHFHFHFHFYFHFHMSVHQKFCLNLPAGSTAVHSSSTFHLQIRVNSVINDDHHRPNHHHIHPDNHHENHENEKVHRDKTAQGLLRITTGCLLHSWKHLNSPLSSTSSSSSSSSSLSST